MSEVVEKSVCKYCKKSFSRESSLSAHLCEPKRRVQQEKETGVQFGLRAFLRFFEVTQGSAKNKTYTDFMASPYYSAFVKFGQYIVSVQAVNPAAFIDWIIKSNKKLDQWTKDSFYDEYLSQYLRTENVQDALERAMKEMEKWGEANDSKFNHIFMFGNSNKICQMINNGRISPWILYNCESGVEFLGKLNEKQVEIIYTVADPEYWQKRFRVYNEDTKWVKEILKVAGL